MNLYEERGADAVRALRGMFAFALHDARAQRVVLGRDRLGEKPLYLHETPGRIAFGSEVKAMLAGGVPFALDPAAVDRYFHYLFAPEPGCVVQGLRQLDAGCVAEIDLIHWRVVERRYWSALDAPGLSGDPARHVRDALDEVGQLIVRADVPVGVALSGGLDSGTVAALAARAHGPGLVGFSVGYPGRPPHDERDQAAGLARQLGIPLYEVELADDAMADEFPATVRERDEPIADIAGFGHRAVMRLAREHDVPVLLTGYGGDELFWGYPWLRSAVKETEEKIARAPRGFPLGDYLRVHMPRGASGGALREWWNDRAGARSALERRARHRASAAGRIVLYELTDEFRGASAHARELYGAAIGDGTSRTFDAGDAHDFSGPQPRADLAVMDRMLALYLRSVGLAQGDRLAMARSVEARAPLVDYRLVETVVGLTREQPGSHGSPKAWLRAAMADTLPAEVLARPKRGFEPPVFDWHRRLMARYGPWLVDGALVRHGILSREGAATLARQLLPAEGWHWLPFSALVLEVWCREMEAIATQ